MSRAGTTSDGVSSPAELPRRPWYRLHASSWVVAGLVLAVLVNLAVPAYRIAPSGAVGRGWPFVAVEYQVRPNIGDDADNYWWRESDQPAWLRWLLWTPNHQLRSYSLVAVAADALVAWAATVGTALGFETWRRRRHRLSQFHVADFFAVPLIVGLALVWHQAWARGYATEREMWTELRQRLNQGKGGVYANLAYVGPWWFKRLFGPDYCGSMHRFSEWYCHEMDKENALRLVQGADQFPWLSRFDARQASIDDDVVRVLCARISLEHIALGDSTVTDAGVAEIAGQSRLRTLDLHGCPITDAGLLHLANSLSLERVDLSTTRVTAAGVARLKQALPQAEIVGP